MHLFQLVRLCHWKNPYSKPNLHIRYLPYARQDKDISNTTTFARTVMLEILKTMSNYLEKITCFDPHSKLPDWITPIYPKKEIAHAVMISQSDLLVFPDKGATEKYKYMSEFFDTIHADKTRDQNNGNITAMKLIGDCKGKDCLIVDDICDGGATFIQLAELLISKGADSVHLYVSHGLFTKGIEPLKRAGIKEIFTKNGEYNGHSSN